MTVVLTGGDLALEQFVRVARGGETVEFSPDAVARMEMTRAVVERVLERDLMVYGLTTGVGARKRIRVHADEAEEFNRRLILNHRVGQGDLASDEVVRGTLLRLANGFAKGASGVRPELAELVIRALNEADEDILRQVFRKDVVRLPIDVPIYFWIADERSAIFAIRAMTAGAFEYGFRTSDRALIQGLLDIRRRFRSKFEEASLLRGQTTPPSA